MCHQFKVTLLVVVVDVDAFLLFALAIECDNISVAPTSGAAVPSPEDVETGEETGEETGRCVFCAFQETFLRYAVDSVVTIEPLRVALSWQYQAQSRFQLRQMNDAAEVYEALLESIHYATSGHRDNANVMMPPPDGMHECLDTSCLAHQTLFVPVEEHDLQGNLLRGFAAPVHYVTVADLVSLGAQQSHHTDPSEFGYLLGSLMAEDLAGPVSAGGGASRNLTVASEPEVFVVGLNWPAEEASSRHIETVLDLLSPLVDLDQVFSEGCESPGRPMILRGMACYYGRHYVSFVYDSQRDEWMLLDDASVRGIGSRWNDLTRKCRQSKYQPCLLFFQRCAWGQVPAETEKFTDAKLQGWKEITRSPSDTRYPLFRQGSGSNSRGSTEDDEQLARSEFLSFFLSFCLFLFTHEHLPFE